MKDDLGENLRSFVAHKQRISEGLETYFQVHRVSQDEDQILLYDMQSRGVLFSRQHMKWEKEPFICNLRSTGIVHNWKNLFHRPLQSKMGK
jgi:hypothetical protein